MGKLIDLTGQKYGKLTVIERCENIGGRTAWICKCECGNIVKVKSNSLRTGNTKTCGKCNRYEDLAGKKFGKLTVLKKDNREDKQNAYWICKCDCGNVKSIAAKNLKSGATQSCGCIKDEKFNLLDYEFDTYKVIEKSVDKDNNHLKWKCICLNCGNIIETTGTKIRTNKVPKCSCVKDKDKENEMINKIFGKLKVVNKAYIKNGRIYWNCICMECGKETIVSGTDLRTGNKKICTDCSRKLKRIDITNKKFGKLTAIEFLYTDSKRNSVWKCLCDCGNITTARITDLRNGRMKSCGCVKSHGEREIGLILNEEKILFKKEYTFENLKGDKNRCLRFDFALFDNKNNLTCLIEYDGEQHFYTEKDKDNLFYNENTFKYDKLKNKYCENNNIKLFRIAYNQNIKEEMEKILLFIKERKKYTNE